MKLFLTSIAAFAVVLTLAVRAQAIDYPNAVRTPALEAKLPTPVKVFCTQNTGWSFAILSDREVYLDLNTCAALAGQSSQLSFERAAHTLYHEWWHLAFQERNEQFTECGAYAIYRQMLEHYWGVSPHDAQQMYLHTWQWSPYAPLPCGP